MDLRHDHWHLPPTLLHVWVDFDRRDEGAVARHLNASQTWLQEYVQGPWESLALHECSFERNSSGLGDPRSTPYIKDIFDWACAELLHGWDIVVFTNEDIGFVPGFTDLLYTNLGGVPCLWGPRQELRVMIPPITVEMALAGYKHCGADLFAFTRDWWAAHRDDFPDMLLSYEAWDLVLRKLMRRTGGIELVGSIVHQMHTPYWVENRSVPGAIWNRDRAREWLGKYNESWD